MTSPLAIELDRYLSQFPALQAAIERYEEIPDRRSLLIVAKHNGLGPIAENLSLLAQVCQSLSNFNALVVEWRGKQHCFYFEDLAKLCSSLAQHHLPQI